MEALSFLTIMVLLAGILIPTTSIGSFVMIAEHVQENRLLRANALNEIFSTVPAVIGPHLSGWLIATRGIQVALLLGAISFFLAGIATLWVPRDRDYATKRDRVQSRQPLIAPIVRSLFSAALLGAIWMAYAIGTVVGALSNTVIRWPGIFHRVLAAMVLSWGMVIACTGLVAAPWILLSGFAAAGPSFGAYPPVARTIIQSSVPSQKRG